MGPGTDDLRTELALLMLNAMQDVAASCVELCVNHVAQARLEAIRECEQRMYELRKLDGLGPDPELFALADAVTEQPEESVGGESKGLPDEKSGSLEDVYSMDFSDAASCPASQELEAEEAEARAQQEAEAEAEQAHEETQGAREEAQRAQEEVHEEGEAEQAQEEARAVQEEATGEAEVTQTQEEAWATPEDTHEEAEEARGARYEAVETPQPQEEARGAPEDVRDDAGMEQPQEEAWIAQKGAPEGAEAQQAQEEYHDEAEAAWAQEEAWYAQEEAHEEVEAEQAHEEAEEVQEEAEQEAAEAEEADGGDCPGLGGAPPRAEGGAEQQEEAGAEEQGEEQQMDEASKRREQEEWESTEEQQGLEETRAEERVDEREAAPASTSPTAAAPEQPGGHAPQEADRGPAMDLSEEAEVAGEESEGSNAQWEVIGGSDSGGILVREASDLTSNVLGRLATGSRVRQLQLDGSRLWYSLNTGLGPKTGWVSVTVSRKALLVRVPEQPEACRSPAGQPLHMPHSPARRAPARAGGPRRLFILDWDDTVFPQTWVEEQPGIRPVRPRADPLPAQAREELASYEPVVQRLLDCIRALGEVAIVTSARSTCWVDTSTREFLPACAARLSEVPVYYSHELTAGKLALADDPATAKKRLAMQLAMDAMGPLRGEKIDLISIGDNACEKHAAQDLAEACPNKIRWLKTVKLKERPTLQLLATQLTALCDRLEDFVTEESSGHIRAADLTG